MHYYQFNIGEYASHTRHLSPIEDIAYRRLLDLAYTTEQPLVKDLRQLTRLINLREYEAEVGDVLKEFFYEADDGWVNNRVIKEIEKTGAKSLAAKNSAAKRWDNERKAKAMREEIERNANASNNHANASNQHKTYQDSASDNSENSPEKCENNANASNNHANASKNDATNNPLPITHNPLIKNIAPLAMLAAMGVSEKLAKDWLAVRKLKKAASTQTAFDAIKKEAEANGYSFPDAVQIATERGWSGFKVSWLQEKPQSGFKTADQIRNENTDKAVQEFLNEPTGHVVEGEVTHA